MPYEDYTPKEVGDLGEAIYERDIRVKVEEGNFGKFVVIDIETGAYEVDEDDVRATDRAIKKRPNAILYGLRIGFPTAYTLGGYQSSMNP